MNVYSQIASNKRRTILFLVGFTALVVALAYVFGEINGSGFSFVGIALIVSGAMAFGSYYYSDRIILSMTGARAAKRDIDFDLVSAVENMAIASGMPKPKVYVIDDSAPNAFATGRDPNHAVVTATTGLVNKLNRAELEGVVAHEMSHIKNYDIRLMAIVTVLAGVVVLMVDIFMRSMWFGRGRREEKSNVGSILLVAGLLLAILSPFLATIMKLSISRKREFLADASGAYLTRNPDALADALEKIAASPQLMKNATNATAHLFIANPFNKKDKSARFASLFNTHPPIEERVKRLRGM